MKLSILICSLEYRWIYLDRLYNVLKPQLTDDVQIHVGVDNGDNTIGYKRNILLNSAEGKYVAFIDDDDLIPDNYIELLIKAIDTNCDCASLKGMYSVDGKESGIFEHSLKYKAWKTTNNEIKYERYPNHLNMIRASIAKQFKFPEINHGEDHDWSTQLHKSGLLKTEHYIPDILYYYRKVTKNV